MLEGNSAPSAVAKSLETEYSYLFINIDLVLALVMPSKESGFEPNEEVPRDEHEEP